MATPLTDIVEDLHTQIVAGLDRADAIAQLRAVIVGMSEERAARLLDAAAEDAAWRAKPSTCRACPDGCGSCTKDGSDCECYEHQNEVDA